MTEPFLLFWGERKQKGSENLDFSKITNINPREFLKTDHRKKNTRNVKAHKFLQSIRAK